MMILRLSSPQEAKHVVSNIAAINNRVRMNCIHSLPETVSAPCHSEERQRDDGSSAYPFPAKRPINNSKNFAESTSTATLAFGTYLSRSTGDVRVLASVGADPRIGIFLAAASASIPGRRRRSPATGL